MDKPKVDKTEPFVLKSKETSNLSSTMMKGLGVRVLYYMVIFIIR